MAFKLPKLLTEIDCGPIGYPGLVVTCWLNPTFEEEPHYPWEDIEDKEGEEIREPLIQPKPVEEFGFKDIIYTKKDWVATITINRPQVYNTYSTLALKETKMALDDASFDDSVAVLVLTSAGEKAFCTGGDVGEYQKYYARTTRDFSKWGKLFSEAI